MSTADEKDTEQVTLQIDDTEVTVPAGTLVIRAAEKVGVEIPRFCDHPLLEPVGACRQCIVEVEGAPKPMTSCTTPVRPDMVVRTQASSPVADKAQRGVMELLLINHPLDCPVCDKGGECPLQNQALSSGHAESRYTGVKRTYPKPIALSSQVLLDRERCVLCARCTRFSEEIAGDPFIDMLERGALQQVGVHGDHPLDSYFSGNTVQICPVGALTGTAYRFRARPFDLVSTPSVCEHCASGCDQRTDHRRGRVTRRLAGDDPEVNEEWNCDKGRWAFTYARARDRITTPMIRGEEGGLVPVPWSTALATAAEGLVAARGRAGVLAGGRLTLEDAYAYGKFARTVLGTHDVDLRARHHSAEEADFLATHVAGRRDVTYSDLESAPVVLLAGFEPEEESPIVFLRLRRVARTGGVRVVSLAPLETPTVRKTEGELIPTVPGAEPGVLDALAGDDDTHAETARLLRSPGAVILVGERLGAVPGGLTAAARLAGRTGARLAWVPRRAGERGAVDAGCLPGLLPGGHPVTDAGARRTLAELWRSDPLPGVPGRATDDILAAAATGELDALLVAGVEAADLPDPDAALAAVDAAGFVVSLELRRSEISDRADVVLPIAPVAEKAGTFLTWEGRERPFEAALTGTDAMPDLRVLDALADRAGRWFGLPDVSSARDEYARVTERLGPPPGTAEAMSSSSPTAPTQDAGSTTTSPHPGPGADPSPGEAVLATWRMLLDAGRMQDGEPHLAGTARTPVARLSDTTAREVGVTDGAPLAVSTDRGTIALPCAVTEMPDRVVWLPQNSPGSAVNATLAAGAGQLVRLAPGGAGDGAS